MSLSTAHTPEERGHTLVQMLDLTSPCGFLFIYAEYDWILSDGNIKIKHFRSSLLLCKCLVIKYQPQRVETGDPQNLPGVGIWNAECQEIKIIRYQLWLSANFELEKEKAWRVLKPCVFEPLILNSI